MRNKLRQVPKQQEWTLIDPYSNNPKFVIKHESLRTEYSGRLASLDT